MNQKNHIALNRFSIKDIETLSGIKAHTLRIWEQRYSFTKPKRTDTNIRYYDGHDLRYILNVSILNNSGFKVSEISKLSYEQIQQKVFDISEKKIPYSSKIKELVLAMFSLDEQAFSKVMDTSIREDGMEQTMSQVIFPFLHQIGVLWLTGAMHPAYEHFISNLVRQKLFAGIEEQKNKHHKNPRHFLLFLPEGEPHELGLLFANYIIRSRGHQVVYLGQNVPFEDLQSVFNFYEPAFVLSALTSGLSELDVQVFTNNIASTWRNATILLTGFRVLNQKGLVLPENVKLIRELSELVSFVDSLQ